MQLQRKTNRALYQPESAGGHALVLATVVVLALLNPLMCSLHCFLFSHSAPITQTVLSTTSFFCDIPDGHVPANESTTAPTSTPSPRAVYDLTSLASISLMTLTLLIALFKPLQHRFTTLFIAPLLPPPRAAR